MTTPLVLYSAISRLAYNIGQRYYRGEHYVWCAPCPRTDPHGFANPPSSDPISIYWRCHGDVTGGDDHSAYVASNRTGLIRGASVKEQHGVIDKPTQTLIEAVVKKASLQAFSPLLLVIPYASVEALVKHAALDDRANPTSEEYIIEALPRNCFDVLELRS